MFRYRARWPRPLDRACGVRRPQRPRPIAASAESIEVRALLFYFRAFRLVEHCHTVDFDVHARSVRGTADAGSGDFFALHKLGKGFVEFRKIRSITQTHTHIHIGEIRIRGGQDAFQLVSVWKVCSWISSTRLPWFRG